MKKKSIFYIGLIVAVIAIVAVVAVSLTQCKWGGGSDDPQPGISLSHQSLEMDALEKVQLIATVTNADGELSQTQVTWSTDNPAVAKVEDGVVTALTAGTATITAECDGMRAVCTVNVSAIVRPVIVLPKTSYEVGKGTTNQIVPTLRLKGTTLDQGEYAITYSFASQNTDIVTVNEKGVITGVKVGTAYITVTAHCPMATAAGIDGELVSLVEVVVVPDYTLSIEIADGYSEDIYLQEVTVGETVYRGTSLLNVIEGRYEDQDIRDAVTFVSSDPEVVTVSDDGVVTIAPGAQEWDTAEVWAQYITPLEGEVNSNRITITVCKAVVEKELSSELIIDLSNGGKINAYTVFGKNETIVDVYDADDADQLSLWDSDKNRLDKDQIEELGERNLVIVGETVGYQVKALVVTKVIRTPSDFASIFLKSSNIANIKADGYYVLGGNIDMTGFEVLGRGWYSGDGRGLVGTFDGRGYTMNGFEMKRGGGIFGVISSEATLKNVAFTNVKVNSDGHAVVLGYAVYGTVENVYVGISEMSSTYNTSGATMGLFAQANADNVLKNIVVVNSAKVEPGSAVNRYGTLEASTNKGAWENVFVISRMQLFGGEGTSGDAGVSGYAKSVRRFNTMEGVLGTDYYANRQDKFPKSIWDYGTLTFHSSKAYFLQELNKLPDEILLTLREKEQLTQNFGAYRFQVNNDNIKRNDNEIWANKAISAADKAWVKVIWGNYSKTVSIRTKREIEKSVTFNLNDPTQTSDLIISDLPIKKDTVKVYLTKLDGTEIEWTVPCTDGKIAIPCAEIKQVEKELATGDCIRIAIEGEDDLYVNGVKLIWVIHNAQELMAMKEHLTKEGDVYDGYLALGADITDPITITYDGCIFNDKETFAGIFDGRMYSIKRLNLTSNAANRGLFSNVSGKICNLKILDATVSCYTAPVVGMVLSGELENVYVKGSITDDGMRESSNLNNFGAGLLAGRYVDGASVKNVIVEVGSIKEGLRLATALGKLGDQTVTEAVFENCYTVGASGMVYMNYRPSPATTAQKLNFSSSSANKNFDDMFLLWEHSAARKLAEETFGLTAPLPGIYCTQSYDMNVAGNDFSVTDEKLTGSVIRVKVKGTEQSLAGAVISGNTLTIPAESFLLDAMPSGNLTLVVETDKTAVEIHGEFIWVISDLNGLMGMKNHLTADGNTYYGSLALGADITDAVTITYDGCIFNDKQTFAGTFDGRMYSIHKISLNANAGNRGLFSNVSGKVCNLKILDVTVPTYNAPIVGFALSGQLENIYVKGKISGDGMTSTSNLNNFGCSLLAGRYKTGASVNNVIVEVTNLPKSLPLATAMGKFGDDQVTEAIFTNCYTVNAAGKVFMDYMAQPSTTATKHDFTPGGTNANFDTMYALWCDEKAVVLARDVFKLEMPEAPKPTGPANTPEPTVTVTMPGIYEMNGVNSTDLVVENSLLTGNLKKVMVSKSYVELENVTLENGKLTVPADSFKQEEMPSGNVTLLLQTDTEIIGVTGKFIWIINSAEELLAMKDHMIPNSNETVYTGHLALGADIEMSGKLLRRIGLTGTTFDGVFDGRLHKLSNVVANNSDVGLFANVSGTVKNLLVTDSYISDSTAPIVGGVLTGKMENIYVSGRLLRDGISIYTNAEPYGAGLLAGRIASEAKISNVITEVQSIGNNLMIATAMGKLMRGTDTSVFENCYTVGANGADCLIYNNGWNQKDLASRSFTDMVALWRNAEAAELARTLGLGKPVEEIVADQSYDLNSSTAGDLVISNLPETITAEKVTMIGLDGTEIEIAAALESGSLKVKKADITAVQNQLATGLQKVLISAGEDNYCITDLKLYWVINNTTELMDMKSHLTASEDGKTYTGYIALGADLDLAGVNLKNNPMKDIYFDGIFDGRFYTLSNMNVITSASRVGLLGHVYGTVRNLRVISATVTADSAAVVGGTLFGTVENVYVQGKITGDNMKETTNLNNFGSGLLVAKFEHDAKIKDCIVELTEIADGLRLATAYGKAYKLGARENGIFYGCYAIGAEGCTFMSYRPQEKQSFATNSDNKNFDSMYQLWQDETARALAQKLGIAEPEKPGIPIRMESGYDMNSPVSGDLVIEDSRIDGSLISIVVKGTEIAISGANLEKGKLTIPAESFLFENMPSGDLVLRVATDAEDYDISGKFTWIMNNKAELLEMKSHLTTVDGVIYDGSLALGADISEEISFGNTGIFTTSETFDGSFDGRMHSIQSMAVTGANIGLFTNVSGEIRNLKIMNATVAKNTAILAGRIFTGTIENVYIKGSITADGMGANSNLNNFGCGLLVARYQNGAEVNNVIVEATSIADGLRLATAFGKLGDYKVKDTIFTNCFAVGANGAAYMDYKSGQTTADKLDFAGETNGNYESYADLWMDAESTARKLAEETFKLSEPQKTAITITMQDCFDMNVAGNDFVVTDSRLIGTLEKVFIQGTEITVEGATLANGVLTIPASNFQYDTMPSGMLTVLVETDAVDCQIIGEFVWVIHNASDLLKMKNHLTTSDASVYDGSLALGADIDLTTVMIKNSGMTGTTFAGTFDGRMYTLSNMKANTGNIGLFGHVSGMVKNLKFTNVTVSSYTAAIAGGLFSGTIENVYVQGSVTGDGMSATSNLANFGSGLLVGKIQTGARFNSCIVELTSIADDLRLATAYGKMHQSGAKETDVFTNCYAVNANSCTFMKYSTWEKVSFTVGGSNGNFSSMAELYTNAEAAALANKLGLNKTDMQELTVKMEKTYDMNVKGNDLQIKNAGLTGTLSSVTVQGSGLALTGATLADGVLTIPASAFQQDNMPTGNLSLVAITDKVTCTINGDFVWVINNSSELLKMKNHMTTADDSVYDGMLALGADINLSSVTIKNNGMSGKTFAGTFDGRMYTLSNMKANTGNIGLFGHVSGTVKNLKFTNVTVSSYTAATAGGLFSGTIENVYVQGSVTGDGMSASSNLANFGSGLLVGRIQSGAKIQNAIVELTSMKEGLRLATAFGKLHQSAAKENAVFTNCYAIGADACTFMKYSSWTKVSFTEGSSNKNFADLAALLANDEAAKLAESLGLTN